jgi:hypothetical protein
MFGKLAMFRVSTTLSGTTRPPNAHNAPAGNALDWEFEGSITDSVRSATWSLNWGSPGYTSTIARMPVCNAGTSTTFRAGQAISLDGSNAYALDGNSTLNVIWQQTSGPTALLWSSHAATMPSLTGSVSGTYTFSQVASDASGNKTAPCTVTQGAVATDANGVVLVPNSSHSQFISNLTRMGVNPWPWFDQKQIVFLDWLVDNIDTYYAGYWDTENEGTVQVNSSQIIGTGTHFQSLFCSGGTTPDIDANSGIGAFQIVIHYAYKTGVGYDGLTGRQELPIWRCTSDTVLEIGRYSGDTAYFWLGNTVVPNPGLSGATYNAVTDAAVRNSWVGSGPRPLNYYDNVLALYSTYYRTGHTKYRDAARTLADRFWRQPWIDRAARFDGGGGGLTIPNRSMALTGVILRALDNPPEDMWPALRRMFNFVLNLSGLNYPADNYDFREGGYGMKWVAEVGMVDSASRSSAVTKVLNMLTNKWTPQRQSDGSWNNFTGGWFHTALGGINGVGTVALTNGSTAVVGSGANLNSGIGGADACNSIHTNNDGSTVGNYIVFYPTTATSYTTSSGANTGDATGYLVASVTDDNHMTLTTPYTGTTGSKYWACGYGAIGMGKQPFMLGITAQSFLSAAELLALADATTYATQIALYKSYAADIGTWLEAHRSADGGIWYTLTTPACEGVQPAAVKTPTSYCDTTQDGNIINYAEASWANAGAYIVSPSAPLRTTNDLIWSMMFGKPGTGALTDDSRYMWELENYMATTSNPGVMGKWLGFFFGVGRTAEWPAIRLGGLASVQARTMKVSARIADHPLAAKIRVTVIDPQGVAATPIICTSSPCTITTPDARQGGHLYRVDWLDSTNAVVLAGDYVPLTVQ